MLEQLKQDVYEANVQLPRSGLVVFTWGNVSAINRESGLVVIKPSGVEYARLSPQDMVVVDLEGNTVEGRLRPSSDLPTHLELYRSFPNVGGIVHTHSRWATIWSQCGRSIPPYGTTHADYMYGSIPCTRMLTQHETEEAYERNTGKVIVEAFSNLDPGHMPAVLVHGHGPFAWGRNALHAVETAVVLEEVAMMAWHSEVLAATMPTLEIPVYIKEKHFSRKHGANAYYGQK